MKNAKNIIIICLFMLVSAYGEAQSFNKVFSEYIEQDVFNFSEVAKELMVLKKNEGEVTKEAKIDKVQVISFKDSLTPEMKFSRDTENYLKQFIEISNKPYHNTKIKCYANKNGKIMQLVFLLRSEQINLLINIEGLIDETLIDQIISPRDLSSLKNLSFS